MRQALAILNITIVLLMISSCDNTSHDTPGDSAAVSLVTDSRADVTNACCFRHESEFLPFFPADSSSDFRWNKGARDFEINCPNDTLSISYYTKGYLNWAKELLSVKISDYCAKGEAIIDSTYRGLLFSYRNDKATSELNEFDVPKIYVGFTCYLPRNKFSYAAIVVDHRFLVEITHHKATNSKSVMQMIKEIPLSDMAKYKK